MVGYESEGVYCLEGKGEHGESGLDMSKDSKWFRTGGSRWDRFDFCSAPLSILSHVRLGDGLSWAHGQGGCRSLHTEVDGARRVSAGADAGRDALTRMLVS